MKTTKTYKGIKIINITEIKKKHDKEKEKQSVRNMIEHAEKLNW